MNLTKLRTLVRSHKLQTRQLKNQLAKAQREAAEQQQRADDLEHRLKTFVNVRVNDHQPELLRRAMVIDLSMTHQAAFYVSEEQIYQDALHQLVTELHRRARGELHL